MKTLNERLDLFEDALLAQVGDSMFLRARNLERELGIHQLWLKFEGDNPTGTQKDRIAWAQTYDALRRGFDVITVATCGNYGAALALSARTAGLRCVVVIPEPYQTRRLREMPGAEVLRVGKTYEDAVVHSRELALEHEWYDANPGGENERVQLHAYGEISFEVYDQLRDAPAVVACPMSNGTTLAGVHRGFTSLNRRGKTSRCPRMVGGSAWKKNPIVAGWLSGAATCPTLPSERIHETSVNEPLINWSSIDGDLALQALRESKGFAADVTDKQMRSLSKLLREQQALHVLPASTAGLHALLQLHALNPLPPDRYVVVLTGRSS